MFEVTVTNGKTGRKTVKMSARESAAIAAQKVLEIVADETPIRELPDQWTITLRRMQDNPGLGIPEFVQEARRRIEAAGLRVGYQHQYESDPLLIYVASFETVPGTMGQPVAEAQYNHGHIFYSSNIRNI